MYDFIITVKDPDGESKTHVVENTTYEDVDELVDGLEADGHTVHVSPIIDIGPSDFCAECEDAYNNRIPANPRHCKCGRAER